MRRLLLLVLCLLIPLQGHAVTKVEATPCPMQEMMDMESSSSVPDLAMDDCCNDLATFELTGEACKSSQGCGAPTAGSVPSHALALLRQEVHPPPSPAWRVLPPGLPAPHWRPPASH